MSFEIETQQYDYLDKSFKKPASTIYRINVRGKRYYYEMINGEPVVYASGTTLISDGYPAANNAMEEWKVKMRVMGKDPAKFAQYRADYGTIMHILFGHYLEGKKIPLSKLDTYIRGLKDLKMSKERVDELMSDNLEEFTRDLLSFAQWVKDYNVKPLAIEMMIRSQKYQVATAIDLICEMDYEIKGFFGEVYKSGARKGEAKETKKTIRIVAIVDFKSGKKGFYPKHALQLLLNKQMVLENYPKLKVGGIFNFSPKEWRSTPTYNFTNQSEHPVLNELTEVLTIGKKRHAKKNKSVKIYKGILDINAEYDTSEVFEVQQLTEFLKEVRIEAEEKKNKEAKVELKPEAILERAPQIILNEALIQLLGEKFEKRLLFRIALNKQKAPDLKQLGKTVGVKYTKKQNFIKEIENLVYGKEH